MEGSDGASSDVDAIAHAGGFAVAIPGGERNVRNRHAECFPIRLGDRRDACLPKSGAIGRVR